MILGVPLDEIVWLAHAIVIGAVVTGLLAGLFGVGGGLIIVPVLYEMFRVLAVPEELRMQLSLGTSFAVIVPTTIRSYLVHRTKGAVMTEVVRQWALPSVVGVAIGSFVAAIAPGAAFKIVFVLFVNAIAFKLLFGRESWRLGDELPGRAVMVGYGGLLGLISTLVGVSGGALCNMFLALYGTPSHKAVATAAGIGVPVTLAATIGYVIAGWGREAQLPPFSIGFVSLIGVMLIAPISSFTATYGARLAHALPGRRLEIAFGLFLLAASARFLASLVW